MAIVVTDNCRLCRFTECVAVCPVACFHADEEMVYIDNDTCIDCMACIPVCPVKAVVAEDDLAEEPEALGRDQCREIKAAAGDRREADAAADGREPSRGTRLSGLIVLQRISS